MHPADLGRYANTPCLMPNDRKRNFFTVESLLIYGSTACNLMKEREDKLDETIKKMVHGKFNKSWQLNSKELHRNIPKLSEMTKEWSIRYASHYCRSKKELVSYPFLLIPKHGYSQVNRPCKTYISQQVLNTCNAQRSSRQCKRRSELLDKKNQYGPGYSPDPNR